MTKPRQGHPATEIEITPEMIEAGALRLRDLSDQALDYAAEEAYRAMELARRLQSYSTGSLRN